MVHERERRSDAVWKRLTPAAVLAALATAGLVIVAGLAPDVLGTALEAYLLCVAALGVWALAGIIARAHPVSAGDIFERLLRAPAAEPAPPEQLQELTRTVMFASYTAADLHYRLRPVLREVAAHRLATRHHVDLDRQPERARSLLGEAAWELLRPDRPPPADPRRRGPDLATVQRLISALEL